MRYDDWLVQYNEYLESFVFDLYMMAGDQGVSLHYINFKADMLKYIYKTSVSRYRYFTSLGN